MIKILSLLIAGICFSQISCTYQERSGGDYSYSRILLWPAE